MKTFLKILKWIGFMLLIPIFYFVLSFLFIYITIYRETQNPDSEKTIFLSTNGVHLGIVIPREVVSESLTAGIKNQELAKYLSFGWGDENFYLHTLTWNDLTFNNASTALFLNSPTLMHVTQYPTKQDKWVAVNISKDELSSLTTFIEKAFRTNKKGQKIILDGKGYHKYDDFYRAKGSYSALNTCNSWANLGFKESGMKACFWTPFDFGLINKYK